MAKTKPIVIQVRDLAFGDEFRRSNRHRKVYTVQVLHHLSTPPHAGKVLIVTNACKQLLAEPTDTVIHMNPPAATLPGTLVSRLPQFLDELSMEELRQKLHIRTQQLCQNTDISSHLVDLLTREVCVLQEKIHEREASERRSYLFHYIQRIKRAMLSQAINKDRRDAKYEMARTFLGQMLHQSRIDDEYAKKLVTWISQGGTGYLRDQLLTPIGYDGDYIVQFNAFTLIDDLGVNLREGKEGKNG